MESKAAFMDAVGKALGLPDYFGHNWDALDECPGEITEPTHVLWTDADRYATADQEGFAQALACFAGATHVRVELLPGGLGR